VEYVIEAENIRKSFGSLIAVDGISFNVRKGESFGLLGPNGAGKTTTIRMIYGFSPMTAGSLRIFGLDIGNDWRQIKGRIGICQQENSLDPDLSVQQNLEVFARYFDIPKKEAKERTRSLLRFISMEHRKDDRVTALSGGLMRRLVIARALINNPDLMILDEPTTGLDPQSRHQVWERLEELKSRGLTILLTTHYMEEAARLCDRLVIVDHGKILVEGKPGELIKRYVGREVMEVTEPSEELLRWVQSEKLEHENLGHRLIIYCKEGEELFRTISHRFCTGGCDLRLATLEDVFLKLTGRDLRE
jgi:lipooligosaccharide transport system ATP-binding protein